MQQPFGVDALNRGGDGPARRALAAHRRSLTLALREATRGPHERLERALPLTDPGLSLDTYRAIVGAFYGYYAPLERRLAPASAGAIQVRGRTKLPRLRADLRALGSSDAEVKALPRCTRLPEITTCGHVLGCLYVVEGATLGGRVIARALHDHLGVGPATGAAFFEGYGLETGAMWRALVAQLEASRWPRGETLATAVETFVAFERWLAAQGVLR